MTVVTLAWLQDLDHQLFFALNLGLSTPVLDYMLWAVSALNGMGLLLGVGLALWVYDRPMFKRHVGWLVLAVVLGFFIVHGIKYGLARPRPLSVFAALMQSGEVQMHVIGPRLHHRSFPSGHTQAAASALMYLLCLYPRHWVWWSSGIGIAGLARIYLGAHFPSDVLAGACIGCLTAMSAWQLQRRHQEQASLGQHGRR